MKRNVFIALGFFLILVSCNQSEPNCLNSNLDKIIKNFEKQYESMVESIKDKPLANPRTYENGELRLVKPHDWTSGFYPGILWYLYETTGDSVWFNRAVEKTEMLEELQYNKYTHDLGFMLYCSYGNAYRLTKDTSYRSVLIQGAKTLCTRYDSTICLIRSWDHGSWQYPVIIDNMMNLEYLMWAFKETGDSMFYNISVTHSDNTIKHHFRNDYSTYHVVSYDTLTGEPVEKVTHQGYADESAWARGQAWGLYGYTMMYRETKLDRYLNQANKIADFIINKANMPDDFIPYWDHNAPDIPDSPRDASAAAITASALIELAEYVNDSLANVYNTRACNVLMSLSKPKYTASIGSNGNFVLKHSTGHLPGDSEIDVPLNYADYYYLESLLRWKDKSKCCKK